MPGPTRFRGEALVHASTANKIPAGVIDERARQVLELVNECAASGVKENAEETTNDTPETSALLRRLAAESIVLMKNEGDILPLKKDKKILVVMMFLQSLPTKGWTEKDIELLLSEAFIWQSLFKGSKAHVRQTSGGNSGSLNL